tara:strand:+ start:48 stop:332 length:285 start_codon:yes stop_codon:yes gene_type:complete
MTRQELLKVMGLADRPLTCEEIAVIAKAQGRPASTIRNAVKRAADDGVLEYIGMRHRRYFIKGLRPSLITEGEWELLENERRLTYLLGHSGGGS